MPRLKYFLSILGTLATLILSAQQLPIVLEAESISLETIIQEVEEKNGYLFSYSATDISGIKITDSFHANSIKSFLNQLLKNTDLEYEVADKKYVILSKSADSKIKTPTPEIPLTLLCGQVLDSICQTSLIGANVLIKNSNRGTSTDIDGRFTFKTKLDKGDTLVLSYVGYEEKEFTVSQFIIPNCPVVELNNYELSACVVISEYLTDGIKFQDDGAYSEIQPNKIAALPGQAEPDVLNTIKFLPGISSPDGSASNICIRGGTPDQNLILWEDIPIYHSAHYFGMISAINPYIMNSVKVYRGGFGANYGGRISGLIDLKSEDTYNQLPKFGAGVNFLNGYANGKLKFLKNRVSIIFSLRHSISGFWRSPTFESITRRIHQGELLQLVKPGRLPDNFSIKEEFNFFDSNVKTSILVTDKDKLTVAWLYGQNDFKSRLTDDRIQRAQSDSLYLVNSGSKISWSHQWGHRFTSSLSGLSTDYEYNYNYDVNSNNQGQNTSEKSGLKNSFIKEKQLHLKNTLSFTNNYKLTFGYHFTEYDVGYSIINKQREDAPSDIRRKLISNTQVGYATINLPFQERFGLEAGLRSSYFENEKKIYWEPRFRLWAQASNYLNLYLNVGRYQQFLSQLIQIQGDNSSIETPVWALSGKKEIPVLSANQFQAGGIYQRNGWTVDIQAYVKKIEGLTSLATGFDDQIESSFKLGTADINGLDILLKKRWGAFRTWMSYSYSKVNYKFENFFDRDFSAAIEQPHSFHLVNLWKKNQWECSIGWKITSGTPFSKKENFRIIMNAPNQDGPSLSLIPDVNQFNSERLRLQHQMDISMLYNFVPKNSDGWKGAIGFSIFNVYNQINVYQRSLFIDRGDNNMNGLLYTNKTDLGITPNVVFRMEWN